MTTRYVDFVGGSDSDTGVDTAHPWKRCKGMVGVASTAAAFTPSGGDTIVFKQGVTWTSSFPWNAVGGSSSMVTYTTEVGFGTGAQPTFDYQGLAADGQGNGILNAPSWTTLNDLNFVNAGVSEVANGIRAVYYDSPHDIAITNCTFATESDLAILWSFAVSGSYSNFTVTGNDFSHCSSAIWCGSGQINTSMHNIIYNDNVFHDFTSQIGAGVHGDGAWHAFASAQGTNEYLDTMQFCNNFFYGDFRISHDPGAGEDLTAQFFMEIASTGVVIANNRFEHEGTQGLNQMSNGMIQIGGRLGTHDNEVKILNNSFSGNSEAVFGIFVDALGSGTNRITIKNNAIYNPHYAFGSDATALVAGVLTSDHNFWESTGQRFYQAEGNVFRTYAQWQALGYDANSIMGGDPGWTNYPTDVTLQSTSDLIGAAEDLSSLGITILNSDHNGVARGSSWDIGAYQFAEAPASPSVLMLPATVMQ